MVARTPAILCKTRRQHTTAQIAPVLRRNKAGGGFAPIDAARVNDQNARQCGGLRQLFRPRRTPVPRRSDYVSP
jgi:hypothetical protein